ncbi:MAG: hypothetical protein A2Y45_01570 [Tenericutes bacterium GWC2_34_14]|nr:MAG: hypothetical protein A2Y45_01570 [Tenericutes bacterium GWC2_34_14]OHE33147.1 MAG: hypothetical protein A2012_00510 [Tenericutes bacterium GWE2_34_108]OHE36267.1 MAG: hypothetical protein A2Y46_07500 [Tenericutes bacterium GWF1_35_14]OHE38691.1 MAG: hypothetical protein A2Y44_04730 [Tenericutes bacterium GWF2_35_184]OHE44810.1 MAG: hypothetical protein A2221_01165 [Tenericutes bacterium RIFOXYA2_FULL_36_32]OHE45567.1 MAG: hypothetical protein A3K26_04005 [Tenericutes bacterium RIFOXYA1
MQNKTVRIIQPKVHVNLDELSRPIMKKRVCAYVRVSTDNLEQKTSYEAQRDEYTKRISDNPDWDFCGIFADEGISGTSTKHRKQFNLMIAKAKRGEIDIILTKSISRFARNTVDALNYIRELRKAKVEIIFEKENLSSIDPKVEFFFTMMASMAQEEARNVSENVKWNVQRRFREGVPIINHARFLGYTKDRKGGNLIIDPKEAEIVKLIFNLYIGGMGPSAIADRMMDLGHKTGAGKRLWRVSSVHSVLKNEKYMGDMLQQKTICTDYLNHTRIKNKNYAPTFYTENSHEGIIDKETFELAQRIRNERAQTRIGEDKNLTKYTNKYAFSAMIICSECGRTLKRRYWNYGKPSQRVMQQCGGYIEGKANCKAKATYDEVLEGTTIKMLNEVFLKDLNIMDTIKNVIKTTIVVDDLQAEIDEINLELQETERMLSNLIDTRVKTPEFSEGIFTTKYNEYTTKLNFLSKEKSKLELEHVKTFDTQQRLDMINSMLKKRDLVIETLDSDILRSFIYKMISVSPEEIVYCVAGTKNYSDAEFSENRKKFLKLKPIYEGHYHNAKYDKFMNYKVIIV